MTVVEEHIEEKAEEAGTRLGTVIENRDDLDNVYRLLNILKF